MTVYEFIELLISDDQIVELWDNNTCESVFKDEACKIPEEYHEEEITSIDPIHNNIITLNIGV